MSQLYLYASEQNPQHTQATRAVIVLPEIFGITDFIKRTTEKFASEFALPSFALDHFYSVTGKAEVFDYHTGIEQGEAVMGQVTGEGFYKLFTQALDDIQAELSSVKSFVVCGFCFGGRLAYLAGMDKRVAKAISFYGGQPHIPDYYEGKSPIEALVAARQGDSKLAILSFYGGQDESILSDDRAKTKQALLAAKIDYTEKVYDEAGHAYFNDSRTDRYHSEAALASWADIQDFLK